jgi:hypothetical protein
MRFPPFASLAATTRVFAKAILLVIILNVICLLTGFNPIDAITQFNLWSLTGHGRERLVYMSDFDNGLLPLNSLLATHTIAYTPKAPDEFRVVVLGNSGPFGAGLDDTETLTGQLNNLNLQVNEKKLAAYNLAFPSATVVTNALIADESARYQPDWVICFVTADMFNNREAYLDEFFPIIKVNRAGLEDLAMHYGMSDWLRPRLSPRPIWYSWLGIRDQGTLAVWFGSLFYPFESPDLRRTDARIAQRTLDPEPNNFTDVPGTYPILNDTWQFLLITRQIVEEAGGKLLIVNQPTLILEGSGLSYSNLYGRAFYDAYHSTLKSYTQQHDLPYLDLWDVAPAEHFTDSELHMDAAGWGIVANELVMYLHDHPLTEN